MVIKSILITLLLICIASTASERRDLLGGKLHYEYHLNDTINITFDTADQQGMLQIPRLIPRSSSVRVLPECRTTFGFGEIGKLEVNLKHCTGSNENRFNLELSVNRNGDPYFTNAHIGLDFRHGINQQ